MQKLYFDDRTLFPFSNATAEMGVHNLDPM